MGYAHILSVAAAVVALVILLGVSLVAAFYTLNIDLSGDTVDIQYSWYDDGQRNTLELSIPENAVKSYGDSPIPRFGNPFAMYRFMTVDDPLIQQVVGFMNERTDGMSDSQRIGFVLTFVQKNIDYVADSGLVPEHWQYPVETLYLGTGDCEDTSLLFATIVAAMGYDVVLIIQKGHCCAGVALEGTGRTVNHAGKEYVVCETTTEWPIGYDNGEPVVLVVGSDAHIVLYVIIGALLAILAVIAYVFRG